MRSDGDNVARQCQLLDVRAVAELLGVHPRTVWRMAAMAECGQYQFPRVLTLGPKTKRWRASDVHAYVERLSTDLSPA